MHPLLALLTERPEFPVRGEDLKILDFFVEYLDHGSLKLLGYENNENPRFTFTNEAQRYHFTMAEIREYYRQMKSGIPMDWENVPFEYITK
jgi:hypothetical protein